MVAVMTALQAEGCGFKSQRDVIPIIACGGCRSLHSEFFHYRMNKCLHFIL